MPAVWAWKRSMLRARVPASKRSRMMRAHSRRAARYLATSSSRSLWALKKNDSCGRELVDLEPGLEGRVT